MSKNHGNNRPPHPAPSNLVRECPSNSSMNSGGPPPPRSAILRDEVGNLDVCSSGEQGFLERKSSAPPSDPLPNSENVSEVDFLDNPPTPQNPGSPSNGETLPAERDAFLAAAFDCSGDAEALARMPLSDTEPPSPPDGQLPLPAIPPDPSVEFGAGLGARVIERTIGEVTDIGGQAQVDARVLRAQGQAFANTVCSIAQHADVQRTVVQERLQSLAGDIQLCGCDARELSALFCVLEAVTMLTRAARTLADNAPTATRVALPELVHAMTSWFAGKSTSPARSPEPPRTPPTPKAAAPEKARATASSPSPSTDKRPPGRPSKTLSVPTLRTPPEVIAAVKASKAEERERARARKEQAKIEAAQKKADEKAAAARLKELEREQEQIRRQLAGAPPPKSHKKKPT